MIGVASGGRVAQLGEHLLCKQGVAGSIPVTSTNYFSDCNALTRFKADCSARELDET